MLVLTEQCPSSDVPSTQQWFAQSSDIRGDGAAKSSSSSGAGKGGGSQCAQLPRGGAQEKGIKAAALWDRGYPVGLLVAPKHADRRLQY